MNSKKTLHEAISSFSIKVDICNCVATSFFNTGILLAVAFAQYTVVCGNDGGVDVTESTVVALDGVSVYISHVQKPL